MMTPEQQVDLDLREYEGRLSEWDDSPTAEIRFELLLRGGAWGSVENPNLNTCRGGSHGNGNGHGDGFGSGHGIGNGIGCGFGNGSGNGHGNGHGNGDGYGDGHSNDDP